MSRCTQRMGLLIPSKLPQLLIHIFCGPLVSTVSGRGLGILSLHGKMKILSQNKSAHYPNISGMYMQKAKKDSLCDESCRPSIFDLNNGVDIIMNAQMMFKHANNRPDSMRGREGGGGKKTPTPRYYKRVPTTLSPHT